MVRIGHATGYHLIIFEGRLVLRGGGYGKGRGQAVGLGGDGGPGGRDGGVVGQRARNDLKRGERTFKQCIMENF